jgi:hypothetical protein
VAIAARHPRRVDAATVCALADVLATTRRLEDQIGSAAVLPGIRGNCAVARSLLADARPPIRDRVGALAGELHQYLGWLLAETGHPEQARAEYDAALALGVKIDDPHLTSLALSYQGHLAWMLDDPHGAIALSRAARRDTRVFIGQQAYNAYQEARGWAMVGELAEVDRTLGHAEKLAERAVAQQADAFRVGRVFHRRGCRGVHHRRGRRARHRPRPPGPGRMSHDPLEVARPRAATRPYPDARRLAHPCARPRIGRRATPAQRCPLSPGQEVRWIPEASSGLIQTCRADDNSGGTTFVTVAMGPWG